MTTIAIKFQIEDSEITREDLENLLASAILDRDSSDMELLMDIVSGIYSEPGDEEEDFDESEPDEEDYEEEEEEDTENLEQRGGFEDPSDKGWDDNGEPEEREWDETDPDPR